MRRAAFLRRMATAALACAFVEVDRLLPGVAESVHTVESFDGPRNLVGRNEAFVEWMEAELDRMMQEHRHFGELMMGLPPADDVEGRHFVIESPWGRSPVQDALDVTAS